MKCLIEYNEHDHTAELEVTENDPDNAEIVYSLDEVLERIIDTVKLYQKLSDKLKVEDLFGEQVEER